MLCVVHHAVPRQVDWLCTEIPGTRVDVLDDEAMKLSERFRGENETRLRVRNHSNRRGRGSKAGHPWRPQGLKMRQRLSKGLAFRRAAVFVPLHRLARSNTGSRDRFLVDKESFIIRILF